MPHPASSTRPAWSSCARPARSSTAETFQNEAPGPQWDLNYGAGYSLDRIAAALSFALGRAPTIERLDGDSLFFTALTRARIDQGIPMLVALRRRHAVVLVGYAPQQVPQPDGTFETEELLIVNDPWIGVWLGPAEAVLAGARVFSLAAAGTADAPDTVEARSDEPEVHQDSDGDGVVDFDEIHRFGTHPGMRDTDQDGVDDKKLTGEAHPLPDGDGVVVGIAASQPESPPIDLTWRHSCPAALDPHVVTVQWPGASGVVVDGVLETRHDLPIHGGTLTVTQTLRQVGAGGPVAP